MNTKNTLIAVVILAIVAVIVGFAVAGSKKAAPAPAGNDVAANEPVAMCYSYSKQAPSGLYDQSWVRLNVDGTKVSGEFQSLPAEKDSKKGTFEGTVGAADAGMMRVANTWYSSMAEGMNNTEELNIRFDNDTAVALYGEMVDRGDGTYVYKDASALTPGFTMARIDCANLASSIR